MCGREKNDPDSDVVGYAPKPAIFVNEFWHVFGFFIYLKIQGVSEVFTLLGEDK